MGAASALGAPAKHKKKPAKKPEGSKYKMYKVLTDEPKTYRFDERGEPIPLPSKKPAKKKKKAPPPEDGSDVKDGSAEEGAPPEEKPAGGS